MTYNGNEYGVADQNAAPNELNEAAYLE